MVLIPTFVTDVEKASTLSVKATNIFTKIRLTGHKNKWRKMGEEYCVGPNLLNAESVLKSILSQTEDQPTL